MFLHSFSISFATCYCCTAPSLLTQTEIRCQFLKKFLIDIHINDLMCALNRFFFNDFVIILIKNENM